MCGLEAYADAMVGSLGVEHRKRTTIAVELAAKVFKFDQGLFATKLTLQSSSPNYYSSSTSPRPVLILKARGVSCLSCVLWPITVRLSCARAYSVLYAFHSCSLLTFLLVSIR